MKIKCAAKRAACCPGADQQQKCMWTNQTNQQNSDMKTWTFTETSVELIIMSPSSSNP